MKTTDKAYIEECLRGIISSGATNAPGVLCAEMDGKQYLEGTTETLNAVIHGQAKEDGIRYEATTQQFAVLFSSRGGRLFKSGWRREPVRVIRGERTYRFIMP